MVWPGPLPMGNTISWNPNKSLKSYGMQCDAFEVKTILSVLDELEVLDANNSTSRPSREGIHSLLNRVASPMPSLAIFILEVWSNIPWIQQPKPTVCALGLYPWVCAFGLCS